MRDFVGGSAYRQGVDIGEEIREGFVRGYMTPGVTREQALVAFTRSWPTLKRTDRIILNVPYHNGRSGLRKVTRTVIDVSEPDADGTVTVTFDEPLIP